MLKTVLLLDKLIIYIYVYMNYYAKVRGISGYMCIKPLDPVSVRIVNFMKVRQLTYNRYYMYAYYVILLALVLVHSTVIPHPNLIAFFLLTNHSQ